MIKNREDVLKRWEEVNGISMSKIEIDSLQQRIDKLRKRYIIGDPSNGGLSLRESFRHILDDNPNSSFKGGRADELRINGITEISIGGDPFCSCIFMDVPCTDYLIFLLEFLESHKELLGVEFELLSNPYRFVIKRN